jgi:hypothetical protein
LIALIVGLAVGLNSQGQS